MRVSQARSDCLQKTLILNLLGLASNPAAGSIKTRLYVCSTVRLERPLTF